MITGLWYLLCCQIKDAVDVWETWLFDLPVLDNCLCGLLFGPNLRLFWLLGNLQFLVFEGSPASWLRHVSPNVCCVDSTFSRKLYVILSLFVRFPLLVLKYINIFVALGAVRLAYDVLAQGYSIIWATRYWCSLFWRLVSFGLEDRKATKLTFQILALGKLIS